jgi:hypothetical protein
MPHLRRDSAGVCCRPEQRCPGLMHALIAAAYPERRPRCRTARSVMNEASKLRATGLKSA